MCIARFRVGVFSIGVLNVDGCIHKLEDGCIYKCIAIDTRSEITVAQAIRKVICVRYEGNYFTTKTCAQRLCSPFTSVWGTAFMILKDIHVAMPIAGRSNINVVKNLSIYRKKAPIEEYEKYADLTDRNG